MTLSDAELTTDIIKKLQKDRSARIGVVRESFAAFFAIYFNEYVTHKPARFHHDMFRLAESMYKVVAIQAFRGSGKSTIMNTALAIWGILGKRRKKFILITSQTRQQAKLHFMTLKSELERNELLRRDLGPFQTDEDEWGSNSIVLSQFGARITFASTEQSIRGMRHGPHRPDLIICDDVEDVSSAKTKEGRDKIFNWLVGEILPCGSEKTMIVLIGNMVHEDGLLARVREMIEEKKLHGVFRQYPLINDGGICLWKSRYPDEEALITLKKSIGSEIAWQREMLLRIITDEDRVIDKSWIKYYEEFPDDDGETFMFAVTAVDLAISEKRHADFTAMVSARVYKDRDGSNNRRIFILPNPINKRLDFPTSLACAKKMAQEVKPGKIAELVIENVGFQASYSQTLKREGFNTVPYSVAGRDKRTRLAFTSEYVKNATVLFPHRGCEELITQIVNFGIEKHDDLADAFSMCVDHAITRRYSSGQVWAIPSRSDYYTPSYSIHDIFPRW
jgi:predicted phage terminase large subunit-like protein